MAELIICNCQTQSEQKNDIRSINEDEIKGDFIRPYNYHCQLDQYNVKLCGLVFDAIGAPDFFVYNEDEQNNFPDVFQ